MASMLARFLGAGLERPVKPRPSRLLLARMMALPSRRGREGWALYIAKSPAVINNCLAMPNFGKSRQFRALWIIDSFLTEAPPSARLFSHFDLIIYTQKGEAAHYERLAPGRTLFLGWGTDALDMGSASGARDIDVLRVGRQPEAWDDDARSAERCARAGLFFHGRPAFAPEDPADPAAGQRALMSHYARAKFTIAHSNLAAPSHYTHPTKEYITGRWTDALAAGATVAGVQPWGDASTEDLLWPGATLDFDRIDLKANVEALREAVAAWTPEDARRNHREALRRLDWRWRFKALAERMEISAPLLDAEIARLEAAIVKCA
jgi:hypothetical protein